MAKKKRASIAGVLVEAVSDIANAASVAATGSEIGVLELAAEDELKPNQTKRARRGKAVPRKRVAAKKARKPIKKKSTGKQRERSRTASSSISNSDQRTNRHRRLHAAAHERKTA